MNVEDIKKLAKQLKEKQEELDRRERAIESVMPIGTKILAETGQNAIDAIVEKLSQAFKEQSYEQLTTAVNEMVSKDFSELLEKQTKSIQSVSAKSEIYDTLREVKRLISTVKNLKVDGGFDQSEFTKQLNTTVSKVVNIAIRKNEVPSKTEYKRTAKGKISTVTEQYSDYTLTHTWSYDSNGRLKSVRTVRK